MRLWTAIRDLFRTNAPRFEIHDPNVHRLANVATIEIGNVERALRQSRRMSQRDGRCEEIEEKIKEAERLTSEMHDLIRSRNTDPDDGLLSGMDRRIERGDKT